MKQTEKGDAEKMKKITAVVLALLILTVAAVLPITASPTTDWAPEPEERQEEPAAQTSDIEYIMFTALAAASLAGAVYIIGRSGR